jgi:hypothetical protein
MLVLAAVLLAVVAPGAGGSVSAVIATTTSGSIHALHGWIVWEVNTGTETDPAFRLVAWHRGRTIQLHAASRPIAFDVDLGTDAHGRVVATYSRCRRYSQDLFDYGPMFQAGCRIRIFDLASQIERSAGEPSGPGYSDMTPAIWRGRIAYQQFRVITAGHTPKAAVAQLWLWSPQTHRRRHLLHGPVHEHLGWADAMDLDNQLVAYLWHTRQQGEVLDLRADTPAGRSVRIASGGYGDAGGFYGPREPSLSGSQVWFNFAFFDGDNGRERNWIGRSVAPDFKTTKARIHGRMIDYARDGHVGYGVFEHGNPFDGCTPAVPCTIEKVPDPPAFPASS